MSNNGPSGNTGNPGYPGCLDCHWRVMAAWPSIANRSVYVVERYTYINQETGSAYDRVERFFYTMKAAKEHADMLNKMEQAFGKKN